MASEYSAVAGSLKSATIHKGAAKTEAFAFLGGTSLTEIIYGGAEAEWEVS